MRIIGGPFSPTLQILRGQKEPFYCLFHPSKPLASERRESDEKSCLQKIGTGRKEVLAELRVRKVTPSPILMQITCMHPYSLYLHICTLEVDVFVHQKVKSRFFYKPEWVFKRYIYTL